MSKLRDLIIASEKQKPPMKDPCNNCGWCCLTEVCHVGKKVTGNTMIPCTLLIEVDGKHYCHLVLIQRPEIKRTLAIGKGCDAKTQAEAINEYNESKRLLR